MKAKRRLNEAFKRGQNETETRKNIFTTKQTGVQNALYLVFGRYCTYCILCSVL